MNNLDAWLFSRLLCGHEVNGELSRVSRPYRRFLEALAAEPLAGRAKLWEGYRLAQSDPDALVKAVTDAKPQEPAPEASEAASYATLADIARIVAAQPWLWPGWLASGVLNALASEPGTGKTRFALDLARRLYFREPWPDGQANTLPAGTRTLWIQGDRNFAEMLQAARDFGLPVDAVILNATPAEPFEGLNLDDPETLVALGERITAARPALVVIDTVGMTTAKNLCRPEDAREYFAPLMDLAGKTGVPFLGHTHLSMGKEALGRRIVEKARVVLKMTCPDPEGQPNRRRLWVDKTAVVKPPALGITMGDKGNEYDSTPPTEPEPVTRKPGPPPAKLAACMEWLRERLTPNPARVSEVRTEGEKAGHSAKTLYNARDELRVNEYDLEDRKWWKLPAVDA